MGCLKKGKPKGTYILRVHYLVIAPRLAYVELKINGVKGKAYLRPKPSQSGDILLHSGLHTTIYSDGILEVTLPSQYLKKGENTLELISRDGGDYLYIDNPEKIERLDRMANGAGFLYQAISLIHKKEEPMQCIEKLLLKPSILYKENEQGQ